MIVLDTNVVSEPLRPEPDAKVLAWLDRQEPQSLFLTSVTLAEVLAGVEVMPAGRRKTTLRNALTKQVLPLFADRILSFDSAAAEHFARILSSAASAGHTIGFPDCAIASMAAARGFMIATRNVRDFRGTGVDLINPWDASRRASTY